MATADDHFRAELKRRGIAYTFTFEELYQVEVQGQTIMVNLDNIRRNYERDQDPEAIVRFAERVSNVSCSEEPAWEDICGQVRYSLEPANYETGFDGVLLDAVNDELNKVFVYTLNDGAHIAWITESSLESWNRTRADVADQAERNMTALIDQTQLEVGEADGFRLGMLSLEETSFKAALILSPAFRQLVEPALGWPVFVVAPCRDFAYVIPHDQRELLGRLAPVVVREFRNSGYPITKHVLELSNSGIKAIGTFAV